MKFFRVFLVFFLLMSSFTMHSQEKKTIYITLDMSGSMRGIKYEYANYAAQVISVMNEDNDVFLIKGSRSIDLSGGSLKAIQKKYKRIRYTLTEIKDIKKFNKLYDSDKKQEIVAIGDGFWDENKDLLDVENDFKDKVESGNLRVTFLETLASVEDESDFEKFLKEHNLAKIYKTDNGDNLIKSVNTIVEEISGVSSLPESEYSVKDQCLSFTPLLNVKQVVFLYQDATSLAAIPKVMTTTIDGINTNIKLIGQPSTQSFQLAGGLISSNIYKLDQPVKAGTELKLCFDKNIDIKKLKIFPISDTSFSSVSVETDETKTSKIDLNTYAVCNKRGKAIIKIDVNQDGNELTEEAIKRTEIKILSKGHTYQAVFKDGYFVAEIPIKGKETTYRIESKVGYIRINSGQKKIIKTGDCKPLIPKLKIEKLGPKQIGILYLDKSGCNESFKVIIVDKETGASLDPKSFNISVNNNYKHLFHRVDVDFIKGDSIQLTLESRGFWCSCFVPNKVTFDFVGTPKKLIDGKMYKELQVPLEVVIDKTGKSWFQRCNWLFYSLLASLLLIWYFLKITRKHRFRRGAKIILESPSARTIKSLNPTYLPTNFNLRKEGFFAWLNRWLNPFKAENNVKTFSSIGGQSFHFTATRTFKQVTFPKSQFKPSKMQHPNYDEYAKSQDIIFDENSKLTIKHRRLSMGTISYFLNYSYPRKSWDDVRTFRNTFRTIIGILFLYILFSTYLIIISIL